MIFRISKILKVRIRMGKKMMKKNKITKWMRMVHTKMTIKCRFQIRMNKIFIPKTKSNNLRTREASSCLLQISIFSEATKKAMMKINLTIKDFCLWIKRVFKIMMLQTNYQMKKMECLRCLDTQQRQTRLLEI